MSEKGFSTPPEIAAEFIEIGAAKTRRREADSSGYLAGAFIAFVTLNFHPWHSIGRLAKTLAGRCLLQA